MQWQPQCGLSDSCSGPQEGILALSSGDPLLAEWFHRYRGGDSGEGVRCQSRITHSTDSYKSCCGGRPFAETRPTHVICPACQFQPRTCPGCSQYGGRWQYWSWENQRKSCRATPTMAFPAVPLGSKSPPVGVIDAAAVFTWFCHSPSTPVLPSFSASSP